jgi:hypothetical protein
MTRLILTAGLAALFAFPAFAQQQCNMRSLIIISLAETYGEERRAVMLAPSGAMFELFANLETGTWTYTRTTPDMVMCMMAAGEDYEEVTDRKPPNL